MNLSTMLEYSLVSRATEQEMKLLIRLRAPDGALQTRKPLNMCIVLDRSGSMGGDRLYFAKQALKTVITHLGHDDVLSLVMFDDAVQVLLEPTLVKDKDKLKQLVDYIVAGGSTNLSGGWLQGLRLLEHGAKPGFVNRCILLTDGQANVGIQDSRQLAELGKSARREFNVVTTTVGIGEGFNEELLIPIARESGGAFYYIDRAEHVPAVVKEELQGLLKLVAQNATVTLTPEPAVRMVAQWTDYPAVTKERGITFTFGDAYAEEEKNLLVSLLLPGLKDLGPATVAHLTVTYEEIGETEIRGQTIKHEVRVNVADEDAAKGAKPEVEVLQQFGLQFAAKARKQAIAEADSGDYGKAERTLRDAMKTLTDLPDPDGLLKDEVKDLAENVQKFDPAQYNHNRKLMSEAAYSMSTGGYAKTRTARERRRPSIPPSPPSTKGKS